MPSKPNSRSSHPSRKASTCFRCPHLALHIPRPRRHTCLQSQILYRHTPCGRLRHAIKVKFLLFASFVQGFNMTSPHNSFSPQPSYKASTCHQSPILALRILRARLQRAFDVNISLFTSLEQGPHMPSTPNSRSPHPLRKASPCHQKSNSCSSHPSHKAST